MKQETGERWQLVMFLYICTTYFTVKQKSLRNIYIYYLFIYLFPHILLLFLCCVRFEVLIPVLMKSQLFRDTLLCRTVNSDYLPNDTATYLVVTQPIFPSMKQAKKLCTLIKNDWVNNLSGIKCIKIDFDAKVFTWA